MRYRFLFLLLLFNIFCGIGQIKNEKEFSIDPSELPIGIENLLSSYLEDAKRIRYYQEIDGDKKSFEVKFKKRRLHYSIEFNESGLLEDVEFRIRPTDIPDESWTNILQYIEQNFSKFTIKKIQQQHPVVNKTALKTLEEAFQNLILPYINYELVVSAKKEKGFEQFEILFDSEGRFLNLRKSIRSKYDHVLY